MLGGGALVIDWVLFGQFSKVNLVREEHLCNDWDIMTFVLVGGKYGAWGSVL